MLTVSHMPTFFRPFALLVGGGLLMVLVLYFVNPFLPERFSLGTTAPVVDETATEGVSITYAIPTDEEMETATSFEAYVPPEQLVVEPVNIPMPLDVVSQEYITAYNALVNHGLLLEAQLKKNVAPAMLQVQTEAAAGNFLKMFEHMVAAREQIAVLNGIVTDANAIILAYRKAYEVPGMTVAVRTNSEALDDAAVTLYEETKYFSSLLEQMINGTVPSQKLISDTEASNLRVVEAAAAFAEKISAVGEAVKIPRP